MITTTGLRSSIPLRPVLAALATLTLLASPVRAEDILRLEGPVTDTTGVLAEGRRDIESAIEATLDVGVQVFVLFVQTTGDRTAEDYVAETARQNSLGGDDALILVALEDRTDQIWVADGLDEITDDELDEIVTGTLEPGLREGDFPAAVIDTIEALGSAAVSAPVTAVPITPAPVTPAPEPTGSGGGAGSGDEDDGFSFGPILALAVIAGGGYLVWRGMRQRAGRTGAPGGSAGAPAPDPAALARQANALLIATDERIRDAAQETDFAEAQYGAGAVTSFRAAVTEARDELTRAFVIRQQLDDAIPEDEPTRIAMLQEIIARTTKAQERLDDETDRIRELHDLERDAPNRIVELPAQIAAVEDRLDATEATMQELRLYAEAVWNPVSGNLEEARKGLAGARTAVTAGSQAIADDDRSAVAVATRTAMEGMSGATGLLDEIDQLATSVRDALRRIPDELTEAGRDLADATSAIAGRAVDPAVDARRRAAESALEAARSAAVAQPSDPLATLRLVTEAHRLADETLLAARDAAAAAARVVAAANSMIQTAAAEVDRAATFIASRRRGVGEVARTRLAEAQRHLSEATSTLAIDAAAALNEGRRAQSLAQEAYRLAQDDFSDWDQGGPGWGQRRGRGGDQTAEVLGAILGGVIGGVLSGGGRSGGGWGGSPWGGSGAGRSHGGGWGGGGGFGSGGFGGGGGGGGGRSSGGGGGGGG
ncbi:MAG: TPM domain-containing protein, partial [Chloroflexota bacterium]